MVQAELPHIYQNNSLSLSIKKEHKHMNPAKLFQLKASWDRFTAAHPKFPMFLRAVSGNDVIKEGTVIEVNITTADGRNFSTNVKLTPEDMQLFSDVKEAVK